MGLSIGLELAKRAVDAVSDAYARGQTFSDAAKALGIARTTLISHIEIAERVHSLKPSTRDAARRGATGTRPVLEGFEIARTSAQVDAAGNVERQWIGQRPERGPVFEPPAGHAIKGVSALLDPDGRELVKWVKTNERGEADHLVDALRSVFAEYAGIAPLIPPPSDTDSDLLTVYPLADLHLGMQSWGVETGENYNVKIAQQRVRDVVSDLVSQSRPSRHAVIIGLGDYFHSNDATAMTPRSKHILDVDGRWPRVLTAGVHTAMAIAEMAAQKHETVTLRFLPGNHDPDAAIALTVALSVAYAGNPRIVVDDRPSHIWYHRHGRVMLGATHGHTMKPDKMAMLLASDRPQDWGETTYRHFFFGHIHHETAKEVGPVRVESFNTLAAKDAYSHAGGYRSGQAMNAITFHVEKGEVGRHRVNWVQLSKGEG